jgi:hypothetical protein
VTRLHLHEQLEEWPLTDKVGDRILLASSVLFTAERAEAQVCCFYNTSAPPPMPLGWLPTNSFIMFLIRFTFDDVTHSQTRPVQLLACSNPNHAFCHAALMTSRSTKASQTLHWMLSHRNHRHHWHRTLCSTTMNFSCTILSGALFFEQRSPPEGAIGLLNVDDLVARGGKSTYRARAR